MQEAASENVENLSESPLNEPAAGGTESQPKSISEFAIRPDFPQCALGAFVDIGGYSGVVIDIVHNSIKVKAPDNHTKSFNFHTLRKLYGPREVEVPPMPSFSAPVSAPVEPPAPKRNIITEPNFSAPIKPINEFTSRADYPQCTFGEHVDIGGYHGVVVEIANKSLKVRSQEEVTKSFNADIVKKVYGKQQA